MSAHLRRSLAAHNRGNMLKNEANWLGERLRDFAREDGPVLNVGASSKQFREEVQPWIDGLVFAPLRARGISVVHQDLKAEPGIDFVGNLFDAECRATLRTIGTRSILCTNVLEHVLEPARLASFLDELLPAGGRLLVTVPHAFPYHPDPIDTMFRPTCEQLIELFPKLVVRDARLVKCGRLHNLIMSNPGRALGRVFEKKQPAANPGHKPSIGVWLPWTVLPFSVCCVDFIKPS